MLITTDVMAANIIRVELYSKASGTLMPKNSLKNSATKKIIIKLCHFH
jgi:hypothetical protein